MVKNILVVVVVADYFAEVPEEVLVKMTNKKFGNELKNKLRDVNKTSEKLEIFTLLGKRKNI